MWSCDLVSYVIISWLEYIATQLAAVVEYTDCISAEDKILPYKCPVFDTKSPDVPVGKLWERWSAPSLQLSTLTQIGSNC